ncbi:MAG: RNA-binding protein, partial [Spirochaetales bacterium]|nr:RNA-binding protein [Spirochaetales bacterium]
AAVAAISQLDGRELDGRNLRVNEAIAKERTERRPSYNNRY